MLSKHTFLPTKSLFIAAGIAACGLAAAQQSANALSLNFLGQSGNNYNYELEVVGGDSIAMGDTLDFSGMTQVTGNSVSNLAAAFFTATGTTDTTATFTAVGDLAPVSGTFSLATFSIESTAVPDSVNWVLGSAGSSITGPAISSVPFEFSPGLGLILSGTLFGALKLRSKFSQKEQINF